MTVYDDDVVALDDSGITIKHYHRPNRSRRVAYDNIVAAELIEIGFGSGRYRLVGYSPRRLRHFFHWDPRRASKAHAVSLDTGGWRRIAITPDKPATALRVIRERIGRS